MNEIRLNQPLQPGRQIGPAKPTVTPKTVTPGKNESTPTESVQISAPINAPVVEAAPKEVEKAESKPVAAPAPKVIDFKSTSVGEATGEALVNANGTLSIIEAPPTRERDQQFLGKYGPWGVVTGASQGIGAEYARALAEKGMNVVMVARNGDKMTSLAKELHQEHGVDVRVVSADLSTDQGVEQVKQGTKDLEVGLLVNNAGAWQMGSFLGEDIEKTKNSVGLNFAAPLKLTHHFAQGMSERGQGGVINVGSMAALHGVPGQATYSGGKGYLQNLTESLHRELKPQGIDVMITNPGPVRGEASQSEYDQSKIPLQKVTGRQVATQSLGRLGKGGSSTMPGWLNRQALGVALRVMPRDMMATIAGMMLERATLPEQHSSAPEQVAATAPTATTLKGKGFAEKYGPWAVVTGASQGLGAVYAEQLAQKGLNVVVVARNGEKLDKLSKDLTEKYGVEVRSVAADLSKSGGVAAVKEGTRDLDVGLLVNNAGVWQMGNFLQNDVQRDADGLGLNVSAPMELCHEFGNRMSERGGGGIINVGSGAGAHGIPGQATYSAGKGFLRNFTEGIAGELSKHNVDVLLTAPAAIKGDASSIYDQSKVPLQTLEPEAVVSDSLGNLGKKTTTTPGLYNRVAMGASGLMFSRDTQAAIAEHVLKRATKPDADTAGH